MTEWRRLIDLIENAGRPSAESVAREMFTTGQRVTFDHAVYGEMTGTVGKVFSNGKVQVVCKARFSGDTAAIRKTTYNIPQSGLRAAADGKPRKS